MPNREPLAELATIAPVDSIEISVGGGTQEREGIREASVGGSPDRSASVGQHGRRQRRAGDCLIAALLSASPLQDDAVLAILRLKSLRST